MFEEKPLLIDARKILDGGIGVYTQNLISDLIVSGAQIALIGDNDTLMQFPWFSAVAVVQERARPYSLDEMLLMPRRVPFSRYSLFHSPHYTLPLFIPIPKVVTVHDLIHCTHPEKTYYPIIAWSAIASAISRADAVIAVSEATARQLTQSFPFPLLKPRHIAVTPNRLADTFRRDELEPVAASSPYIFTSISQAKPHKGLLDLLQAFASAQESRSPNSPAVILRIGGFGAERSRQSAQVAAIIEGRNDIEFLGALTAEQLITHYRQAIAVAIPSRTEGFGFACIEAHSQGTPVIMRPVPALLELRTERDVVAADFSVSALAQALTFFIRTGSRISREEQGELRRSALSYNKERSVSPLLEVYRRVLRVET